MRCAGLRRRTNRSMASASNTGIPMAPPPWLDEAAVTVRVTLVDGEEPAAFAHTSV
jgi:hypothetical protein